MLWKIIKLGTLTVVGAGFVGGVLYGPELADYVRNSSYWVSATVKDDVQRLKITRARNLLAETEPQMRQTLRLVGEEQASLDDLRKNNAQSGQALADELGALQKLRGALNNPQANHEALTEELARRFKGYQRALARLDQNRQSLIERQKAISVATALLDDAADERAVLGTQVDAMEARYRTVSVAVDDDKTADDAGLSETEENVSDLRRQLDIWLHMAAEQARRTRSAAVEGIDEKELLKQVDAHLADAVAVK